jgi:hypothetical protein
MNNLTQLTHLVWKLGNGCDRTKIQPTEKKELCSDSANIALQNNTEYNKPHIDKITGYRPNTQIRESNNLKMSERDPVIQCNLNPFLNSNVYLKDLETQDKFLRPQDSNYNGI